MNPFLLAAVLIVAPAADQPATPTAVASMDELAGTLASELQTGTLLFSQGDCLAVKVFTRSSYTHVAGVVMKEGRPFVYDSQNGAGVRCLPLADWLEAQRPETIHVHQPKEAFAGERSDLFVAALDHEVGRPYAVKHHLTGKRCEGLHCAEFMTDALMAAKLIHANEPPRVSPASLRQGLLNTSLYEPTRTLQLVEPSPPTEKGDGWCSQLWIDTKVCTSNTCVKMRRWFRCR